MKKAIVLGATGLVGTALLDQLLHDDRIKEVVVFARRSTQLKHKKLTEHQIDFDRSESWKGMVKGDMLFSAFGTTIKKAGSKSVQYKIDFTYQFQMAKAAAENGIPQYILVSSAGANAKSKMFYPRMKGELDEAVQKLGFEKVSLIKPSVLDGNRGEKRVGENFAIGLMGSLKWVPGIKKYRPIPVEIVAKAMVKAAFKQSNRLASIELDEVFCLANS